MIIFLCPNGKGEKRKGQMLFAGQQKNAHAFKMQINAPNLRFEL